MDSGKKTAGKCDFHRNSENCFKQNQQEVVPGWATFQSENLFKVVETWFVWYKQVWSDGGPMTGLMT